MLDSPLYKRLKSLGELESLCIVFFDLVDSTYLKTQLGQSRGVNLAVEHNHKAAEISKLFRGRVVKHIGDSIMSVFNTPVEGMLAALEFIRTIHRDQLPYRTKIGLTHGTVTRLDINGADYLGQAVDRSARLTAQALHNQILTDEITISIIKPFLGDFNQVISRFLGIQELKGLGKVPVYEMALLETGFAQTGPTVPEVNIESPDPFKIKADSTSPPYDREIIPDLAIPQDPAPAAVDEPLGRILESCTPSPEDINAVAVGFRNLRHILEKAHDLNIRQISLSGSFARGTIIKPLDTVDVIAVMAPPQGRHPEVHEILSRLDKHLSLSYPGSVSLLSENRLEVSIEEVNFSLIPVVAVIENGRGQLMVPSISGGFWVVRNPAAPDHWMDQASKRNGAEFLPFLRLIKSWQRTNCDYINSFHIELLTDLIASRTPLNLSFESVYQWFWHAYQFFSQNKKPFIKDPGHAGTYVDDYMYVNTLTFNRFSRRLTESYSLAKQGIAYHRAGDSKTALTRWKALFGPYAENL